MANSVLRWLALAFCIITRPGLSSQQEVFTLPNEEGQEVPYTRIVCNNSITNERPNGT